MEFSTLQMLLVHFVEACGVSPAPTAAWEDAWERADAYRQWATGNNRQHDDHQVVRAA
ncbi:hypothetical protein ABZ547_22305 [Streptomyces sparsogenes]|uniref:hypothetical protein n=1 Tax=Streptomyces sparsogenes TaxID=67365 RepID=UPI0033FF0CF4